MKLIEDILSGHADVAVEQPTPEQAARATANSADSSIGYKPRVGSGAYAILLALHQEDHDMTKHEIIEVRQQQNHETRRN